MASIEQDYYDYPFNQHIRSIRYFDNEHMLHRENGPAYIMFIDIMFIENVQGLLWFEIYYKHGKQHREDGPASTSYYINGNIYAETYSVEGIKHRYMKPAYIIYNENGSIIFWSYYHNGRPIGGQKINKSGFIEMTCKNCKEPYLVESKTYQV